MTRCEGCALLPEYCVCGQIPSLSTRVRFVIVRHTSERRRASNTGRLAAQALSNCTLLDHGVEGAPLDLAALDDQLGEGAWALLPTSTPPPPPEHVHTVVVLDGSWPQVRTMRARIPPILSLPTLSLPSASAGALRMRRAKGPEHLATIEAIAEVLEYLGEPEPADELRALFRLHSERVLGMRGMRAPAGGGLAVLGADRPW